MLFTLCGGRMKAPEGPYTVSQIKDRVTELFGCDWYWLPEQADGTFVAVGKVGGMLAEAVPI